MRDKFLLGSLAGASGAVVMLFFSSLLNSLPGLRLKLLFGVSQLFVPKGLVNTLPGNIIGSIAHLICGGLVGIGILYVLEITGYKYNLIKGAALGICAWFLLCGVLAKLLGLKMQDNFLDTILVMLVHIPYGITTAWIINRFRIKMPVRQQQEN